MKKLSLVLILVIVSLICFGCEKQYEGKQIDTITYETVDYMGGYRKSTVFDLKNNQVLQKSYGYNEEKEYEVIYTFDEESEKRFINELYSCGFLNLDEEYINNNVDDGGEWSLSIGYFDETKKVSRGINASPYEIFKKADYAFYNLYGVDLFHTLPTNYKVPESLAVTLTYKYDDKNQGSLSILGGAYKYEWNKSSLDEDIFTNNNTNLMEFFSDYEFNENYEYINFCINTRNSTLKFNNYKLYNYDLNGENEKLIDEGKFFKQKEWPAEMNKIYVVRCEFDYGVAYYAASTKIYNQE